MLVGGRLGMFMGMDEPAGVGVDVALPPPPAGQRPARVGQAERHQRPGGQVAADRLDRLECANAAAHPVVALAGVEAGGEDRDPDAGAAQEDGRGDVSAAAQPGDPQRPAQRPPAGLAEDHERQRVVDADQRVDEADANGGRNQDPDCVHSYSTVTQIGDDQAISLFFWITRT